MAPRFVANQLANPRGLGGRIVRFLMNRTNARMNAFALDQLEVTAQDCVIEVGFGGGVALPRLLSKARFVCGVDPSPDVVAWAKERFAGSISRSVAEFRLGMVETLPATQGEFDKALSVNTVYFWTSLEAGAREIARVLSPGGRIVLGFVPKSRMDRMNMPADIFTPREPDELLAALQLAGFSNAELRRPSGGQEWLVATGLRGAA